MSLPSLQQRFVIGSIQTPKGLLPRVSSSMKWADSWGGIKVRWGVGRMDYTVDPGLYALGTPDSQSPVLVTANYKLSFDRLRKALPDRSAWILVLNTMGVNVWCAAGKGTFGTTELVERIKSSGLEQVVTHRRLILPQLSGPGISAHQVKKLSGFRVIYGPIRSEDLPAFLDAGLKATPEMRVKSFTTWERLVLIPIELVAALKFAVFILPAVFLLGGLGGPHGYWENSTSYGLFGAMALLGAIFAGAVLAPLLLPWIPGRAFALKGLETGLAVALMMAIFRGFDLTQGSECFEFLAWLLIIPGVSAYLAMNFTGASTYTSLSGVKKEMRWAVPLEIAAGIAGLSLWLVSRFLA